MTGDLDWRLTDPTLIAGIWNFCEAPIAELEVLHQGRLRSEIIPR